MNYLAHAFLSFNDPEILVGNMISDFVKGRKKYDLPEGIQRGIILHRHIDQFTDDHPANKKASEYFRPAYRLYAGAFVDVLYDHFLANDIRQFASKEDLKKFTQSVYSILTSYHEILPQRFQQILPYMKEQDWLYNYHSELGLQRSLEGLRRRAVYIHESTTAFAIIKEHNNILRQHYLEFFPELKKYTEQQWRNLLNS